VKTVLTGRATITKTFRRRQYPITGAYTFTDYCSQGQTIKRVIVDIATPPSGGLSLFNLYVALSRISALLAEDDNLEKLNEATRQWWTWMSRTESEVNATEEENSMQIESVPL
ncbi:unnamed protein product, partial [Mycena citricolor]